MNGLFYKNEGVAKQFLVILILILLIAPMKGISVPQANEIGNVSVNELDEKAWTALYYLDADTSNPWWNIFINIDILKDRFLAELASTNELNILVLQDRRRDPANMYYITEDHKRVLLEDLGEVNMGESGTLSDFISYGKERYPAERYQLCIWSHANGWYGVCPDDSNDGDALDMLEFQQALNNGNEVDLLCFIGCCQMSCIESVYQLRNCCEVYVSSESSGNGNDWYGMIDDMCDLLSNQSELSTVEYGNRIVNLIGNNPNEFYDTMTISAIRTDRLPALIESINTLSITLYNDETELFTTLVSAKNETKSYPFVGYSYLLDLYDFMIHYETIETNQQILRMIRSIKNNLTDVIIAERHGSGHQGSFGLSMFYSTKDLIKRYMNSDLDFVKNTYWDELLDGHKDKSSHAVVKNRFFHTITLYDLLGNPLYHGC